MQDAKNGANYLNNPRRNICLRNELASRSMLVLLGFQLELHEDISNPAFGQR